MEFKGNHSVITPEGVFIIGTYDENGTPNAMNAAWGMQSDTNEIALMLSNHKTIENFEKTGVHCRIWHSRYNSDFRLLWC